MKDVEQQHGPEVVCYANDGTDYRPHIGCLCGWHTVLGSVFTWEEAGAEFDSHLAEAARK